MTRLTLTLCTSCMHVVSLEAIDYYARAIMEQLQRSGVDVAMQRLEDCVTLVRHLERQPDHSIDLLTVDVNIGVRHAGVNTSLPADLLRMSLNRFEGLDILLREWSLLARKARQVVVVSKVSKADIDEECYQRGTVLPCPYVHKRNLADLADLVFGSK